MTVTLKTQPPTPVNTKKILKLMIDREVTARSLGRKLGVTGQAISQVIHGRRPKSGLIGKLAKALKVPVAEILNRERAA